MPGPLTGTAMEMPFTASVRELETALAKERAYSRQLYDYVGRITQVYQELQKTELTLRNQIASGRSRDSGVEATNKKLQTDLEEIRTELSRYRRAWSDILLREREAESIIAESTRIRARIEELEAENRGLYQAQSAETVKIETERRRIEDHYRTEIQNALFRLHGAEAKFNNLAQEMQGLEQRHAAETKEAAKREDALRWEMQNKILDERERVKKIFDEQTKKSQTDFERETDTIRAEFTRALAEEKRAAAEGLAKVLGQKDAHIGELSARVGELEETRKLEIEAMTAAHAAKVKSLAEARDAELQRLTGERAAEIRNLTEAHDAHLAELTKNHARSLQELSQMQEAQLQKVTVTRDLEIAQLRETATGELNLLKVTSSTALRASELFGKQVLAEKNAASEELRRVRSLLVLKEEEIRNARDLAEKRKLTILELEFGHSETVALLESTAASRISELETKTSEIIADVKADMARKIAAAETSANAELFEASAKAETRLRETQEAAAVQLRQTQEMGAARMRELEADSEAELKARETRIAAVQQELRVAQDVLAIERATFEERMRGERQNVALEQAETALVREELERARESAGAAAAQATAERVTLEDRIATQEKDFQLLCETLVQAQKAAAQAEKDSETEKETAIEALAFAEAKELRNAALADENELLRKVLEAERQKMREIVLQLKFELKRRKTGVELSPQMLDSILAGADAPDLETHPVDPANNN